MRRCLIGVEVLYWHAGSTAELPLRLRISLPKGFHRSTEALDVLMGNNKTRESNTGRLFAFAPDCAACLVLDGRFCDPMYTNPFEGSVVITCNVNCQILNDCGRPCYRDGGCTAFDLKELWLWRTYEKSEGKENLYITKPIRCSAYNVPSRDALTGVLAMRLTTLDEDTLKRCALEGWQAEKNADFMCIQKKTGDLAKFDFDAFWKHSVCPSEPLNKLSDLSVTNSLSDCLTFSRAKCCQIDEMLKRYRSVLGLQRELVKITEKRTERMRCPWAPTDTVADAVLADCFGHKHDNPTVSDKVLRIQSRSDDDPGEEVAFGSALNIGQKTLLERKSLPKLKYLPLFSYLIDHPLNVSKSHWQNAFEIHASRWRATPEAFAEGYFASAPAIRATHAAQMLAAYAQALEYIPDGVVPSDCRTKNPLADGRKEVEQFWDALVSVAGADCEDLSLAHYRILRAFTQETKQCPKHDAAVRANPVLEDMRRLLGDRYTALFVIDAAHLAKQGFDCDYGPEDFDRLERCETEAPTAFDYDGDTKGMNSAHASLKLFPKWYFKECVNRGCRSLKEPAPYGGCEETIVEEEERDLPVLFVEGTSMLVPCHVLKDTGDYKDIKKTIMNEPKLCDKIKSELFPRKGYSSFYKASLIAVCLDELHSGVATYEFARPNDYAFPPLSRGCSHRQLCHMTKDVCLVPLGKRDFGCEPTNGNSRFQRIEIPAPLAHVCLHAARTKPRARKIAKSMPKRNKDWQTLPAYDPRSPSDPDMRNARLANVERFCESVNAKCAKPIGKARHFNLYMDPHYATDCTLNALRCIFLKPKNPDARSVLEYFASGLPWTHDPDSDKPRMELSCALEKHSKDVELCRITTVFQS